MSSAAKDIFKKGWHPEKEGASLGSQVKGVFKRDKEPPRSDHVARPISSLRDPSTFAPPPRRDPNAPLPVLASPVSSSPTTSPTRGLGAAVHYQTVTPAPQPEEEEPPPPRPYRVDTTGLSTAHLPPPPGRRDGADGRTPPPAYQSTAATKPGPPPSLPPRLPPRAGSGATSPTTQQKPSQASSMAGATARLSAAGISVPGFNIGTHNPPSSAPTPSPSQVNELQSRFARLSSNPSPSVTSPQAPSEGTTLAQKQSALRTAAAFRKDPSSISLSDARAAASTADNFRQRHGDQVAAGLRAAGAANQKYGLADRLGGQQQVGAGAGGDVGAQQPGTTAMSPALASLSASAAALGKKKAPPPPPKKKPGLTSPSSRAVDEDEPPPLPLSTKPIF